MHNLQIIREWVSFAANICILFISLYTFYITFISNKLKILSFRQNISRMGNSMSIVIENKSFSPISITKVCLIVEEKYKISFKKYDVPLVIGPFSTAIIQMEEYSYIGDVNFDHPIFEITTSDKNIYLKEHKKIVFLSRKLKKMHPNVTVFRQKYNGITVMPGTKYVINLLVKDDLKTIFIHESGQMSDDIFGYNRFSLDSMKSLDSIKKVIDNILNGYDIKYSIEELKASFSDETGAS